MAVFSAFTGENGDAALTAGLLTPTSGILVNEGSIVLHQSGAGAVNFFDGSLDSIGIGAGLLLTSGTTPGITNTSSGFGNSNSGTSGFNNGDADIDSVINSVFQTQSFDATTLEFDFTVTDPNSTSITFDIVFGSDEYPEWVDLFVDSAVVIVNGVNYALFNHDPNAPLSVIGSNILAGYFQDNSGNILPIEYDGVSKVLKIIAPIDASTVNHIKIGIADTGDHILDSGIFISNLSAGTTPGSGVVIKPSAGCTDGDDNVDGSSQSEIYELRGGNDVLYAAGGDDICIAGAGDDAVYGGSGSDVIEGGEGQDSLDGGEGIDTAVFQGQSTSYSISVTANGFLVTDNSPLPLNEGADVLKSVEQIKFEDGLFYLNSDGSLSALSGGGSDPVNSAGALFISGLFAPGNVLSATVSDPDGVGTVMGYSWEISKDSGVSWVLSEVASASYTVTDADVGGLVRVTVQYIDGAAQVEQVTSGEKSIYSSINGDLNVTLMQLNGPAGCSTIDPLTTLVKACMDLGLTPNVAESVVKSVLVIPENIKIGKYNAYEILQSLPEDPLALYIEMISVQVAILTSLTDDDHGHSLALKIIEAAQNGLSYSFSNPVDLESVIGFGPGQQPFDEIIDRNKSLVSGISDGQGLSSIEKEWQDLLSIQDGINSTTIADLTIHINQNPYGNANFSLSDIVVGDVAVISDEQLLQGFSDPEGDQLIISAINADSGILYNNGDGTYTFTPDSGFLGPVEITYAVEDVKGGAILASQLLVITAGTKPVLNEAPAITSNSGGATAAVNVAENSTAVTTVTATDVDASTTLSYAISGGADAALFEINAATGALSFKTAPNFEAPADSGTNNVYDVEIEVSDGTLTDTQAIAVTVTNVNEAPAITSNSGGATAAVNVAENSTAVTTVTATDVDASTTLSYAISGGADAARFNINSATGALSFIAAPNFEAPGDSGTNNVYDVEIEVSDGTLTDTQAIAVTVTNVYEQVIVNGTAGDDRLVSQAVNETIAGLAGFDTVVFSGPRLEYDISRVGDTVTVNHLQAGGDGTDTLTGVERLQFADGFMGLVPEELVLFLPGTRDLITWDSTQGSNGFTYFFRLNATTNVAAVADLTGDGRADLLLSQPNGGLVRWDPSQGGNGFSVLPAAPGFDVAAIGDITGNGADDILLKNANGQLRMLDPALGTADDLFALAPGWSLKGVANINGSGKDDIILQNDASGAVIAFTDQGWRDLITLAPGSGWEIAGLGDVVGGLADDFIFRNSNTGVTIFWDTTDNTGGFHDFATIGQGWNLTKVSDLSGDGRDDVVYQNASGLAIYWSGNSWVDLGSTLIGADMMGTGLFL